MYFISKDLNIKNPINTNVGGGDNDLGSSRPPF